MTVTTVKAVIALASDKRTWKGVGIILTAIATPFLLIAAVLCSMLYGTAKHNNAAVDLTFNGGVIPVSMPSEYREYITEMRSCFSSLDRAISEVESKMEDGDSLDSVRVKAVFLCPLFWLRSSAAAHRGGKGICGVFCRIRAADADSHRN